MPLQWRLQVLEARLCDQLARPVHVEETELLQLQGAQRHAAVDALVIGAALPFVLVGDTMACAGDFDVDAIVRALEGTG
ncbi:MAG: hypothetical protein WBI63_01715 [Coriobacteriia bacterium]